MTAEASPYQLLPPPSQAHYAAVADEFGWPIDPPNLGFSDHTADDRRRFERIVAGHVEYVLNIRRKRPEVRYALIDLNAGCGGFIRSKRPNVLQLGTTLRALRVLSAAQGRGLQARLGAIERDPALAAHLRKRLHESRSLGAVCATDLLVGRHEDLAAGWVREHMRGMVRGLIVHDPNAETSRETLGALAALPETRYVDFLLHFNGAIVKWHGTKQHPAVNEVLALCGKRFAYVGPVVSNWQWTWLLLSNVGDISTAGGLQRADRPAGQERLETLTRTRSELEAARKARQAAAQRGLFDAEDEVDT